MKNEFVPYELAVKLKALGFNEPCIAIFGRNNELNLDDSFYKQEDYHKDTVLAPTFSQAFRWFREKYKLIGLVQRDITRNYNGWWFKILSQIEEKYNPILLYSEDFNKDTYEEAELACLKKLIEIVNHGEHK